MNSKLLLLQIVFLLCIGQLKINQALCVESSNHQKTLEGVAFIFVLVGDINQPLTQKGLSSGILKTDVELRLRAAGIRVVDWKEAKSLPGRPYLYLRVTGLQHLTKSGSSVGYSASVDLEFRQSVQLSRNNSIILHTSTWHTGGLYSGPTTDVIRQAVRDLTDEFANAYLMVNPKSKF